MFRVALIVGLVLFFGWAPTADGQIFRRRDRTAAKSKDPRPSRAVKKEQKDAAKEAADSRKLKAQPDPKRKRTDRTSQPPAAGLAGNSANRRPPAPAASQFDLARSPDLAKPAAGLTQTRNPANGTDSGTANRDRSGSATGTRSVLGSLWDSFGQTKKPKLDRPRGTVAVGPATENQASPIDVQLTGPEPAAASQARPQPLSKLPRPQTNSTESTVQKTYSVLVREAPVDSSNPASQPAPSTGGK